MQIGSMLADASRFCSNFFFQSDLTVVEREHWTKEFVQQLVAETTEVLGEINWKHHKLERKEINRSKLLEELVDCQKFLINLFHVWGFQDWEIAMVWARKTKEVEARFAEQKTLPNTARRLTKDEWVERCNELACDNHDLREENAQLRRDYEQLRQEFDSVR